jgi:integrase/recombinase XerD
MIPLYVEVDLNRKVSAGKIPESGAALLRSYFFELQATRGAADSSIINWYGALVTWCTLIDFATATHEDIYRGIGALKQRGLKQNTLHSYIYQIKRFYKWMAANGSPINLDKILAIKPPGIDHSTRTSGEMLTPEEIKKIVSACWRSRDRALFSMMYEGGFRPVELVNLTWGQVKFDDWGAAVNVSEKTGKPRYVRLVESADNLAAWHKEYFLPRSDTAKVFIRLKSPYEAVTYQGMTDILKRVVKKADVGKDISLYLFRHSRITHLVEEGIPESVIKLMMWGSINTGMLSTYAHITGEHVDKTMLDHYGIREKRANPRDTVFPRVCGRCHHVSGSTADFCARCGLGLTDDAVATVAMLKADIWNHPEILMEIAKELQEKKNAGN